MPAAGLVAVLYLTTALGGPLRAQDAVPDSSATIADSTEAPGPSLIPIPVIFYTPETGFAFGASVNYFFTIPAAEGEETRQLTSSISASAVFTTEKQTFVGVSGELHPDGGRYRLSGGIGYRKFPTTFWGVGNDTPTSAEEDFTPESFGLDGELQREVEPGWYVGVVGAAIFRDIIQADSGGQVATGLVPGAQDGQLFSLGPSVTYDSRSSTSWPTRGQYHQFRAVYSTGAFGPSFDYGTLSADLRGYFTLFPGTVLAIRGLGIASTNTPPFDFMPQWGGGDLGRGYFGGRYRDDYLVGLQVEYRVPVWRRFGVVAFTSAGQVAPTLRAFQSNGFRPGVGFGLRFLLVKGQQINVRADFAWGLHDNANGFYFGFGEAF
jgi:outer membrane protein assembly factor BamA